MVSQARRCARKEQSMKIIAVDDEHLPLSDLEFAIKQAAPDADLQCFGSSYDVIKHAKSNHIDIAYIDINMPELNGIELAKKLKEIHPKINIIFTTGYDEYAVDAFSLKASDYLMKPVGINEIADSLKHLRQPVEKPSEIKLRVQCFGNFDVFVNGNILYFKRQKSKELLAYLVHKRGTSCTTKELCAVIYDGNISVKSMDKQIQSVISVMMKTLREADAEDVIIKNYNSISIDINKIDCDYYRYLVKDSSLTQVYTGEYMTNYEWAEFRPEYFEGSMVLRNNI